MQKLTRLLLPCLLACGLLLSFNSAHASQAWVQSDAGVSMTVEITGDYYFGIFDITQTLDKNNSLELISPYFPTPFNNFAVVPGGSSGFVASPLLWNTGSTLELDTNQFGFYVSDGISYFDDYTWYQLGDNYYIDWDNGAVVATLMASAVTPVPVPTAALLLCTGLIGLIGFRRKI